MSEHDPPAADLGARAAEIRARHAEYPPPEWSEVAILLAHIDAQAARLAAWEAHQCPQYRQHHQSRLGQLRRTIAERDEARSALEEHRIAYTALTAERAAAEHERDQYRALYDGVCQQHQASVRQEAAAEQRATRLAALEQAARVWRRLRFREEGVDAAATLDEAVANLDAPPGERA